MSRNYLLSVDLKQTSTSFDKLKTLIDILVRNQFPAHIAQIKLYDYKQVIANKGDLDASIVHQVDLNDLDKSALHPLIESQFSHAIGQNFMIEIDLYVKRFMPLLSNIWQLATIRTSFKVFEVGYAGYWRQKTGILYDADDYKHYNLSSKNSTYTQMNMAFLLNEISAFDDDHVNGVDQWEATNSLCLIPSNAQKMSAEQLIEQFKALAPKDVDVIQTANNGVIAYSKLGPHGNILDFLQQVMPRR